MQIKINLQIVLFIIIFALTHQIEIYACIMIFAFIHELGHMITGIILKLKPKALNVMPFGISITFEAYGYKKLIEIKKIILAIAGPLTNFLIAILATYLHIESELKETIIYSNILIGIFNMLPLYPLDGGRIIKGIIKLKWKNAKADEIVNKTSNIIIILLTAMSSITILYLKNISILFVIIYLWIVTIQENRKYAIKKKIYNTIQKTNKPIDISNIKCEN